MLELDITGKNMFCPFRDFPLRSVFKTARYHLPLQRLVPDWASFRMDRCEVRSKDRLDT